MAKRETLLQQRIARELNANSSIKVIKTHGSPYMEMGTPDLIGCYNDRFFAFEVKNADVDDDGNFTEKASNIQVKRMDQWAAVGAIVGVVRSINDAFDLLGLLDDDDTDDDADIVYNDTEIGEDE